MLKKIAAFYFLGLFWLSWAQASSALELYPYNLETRYERAESQQIEARRPFSFSLAYVHGRSKVLFDYSRFSEKTGNSVSSIDREHHEYVIWYQYSWFQRAHSDFAWGIYNGIGAGTYEEQITTSFNGDSRLDRSGYKFLSSLSMGIKGAFAFNPKYALVGSLEGRVLLATDFDPNPNFGAILRLGLNIQI